MSYKDKQKQKEYNAWYRKNNLAKVQKLSSDWNKNNKERCRQNTIRYRQTIEGRYKEYKGHAKSGGLVFDLTVEDCAVFWKTNCYYCGDLIDGLGIDRIDSSIGYIKENCLPCCTQCNIGKNIYSQQQFISMCQRVVKNLS